MARNERSTTLLYPLLGGEADLGYCRLSGVGLGNSFYSYFRTIVLAYRHQARVIAPAWKSLKIGPIIRGERSKRLYLSLFKPHPDELTGYRKLIALSRLRSSVLVDPSVPRAATIQEGKLNIVSVSKFGFAELLPHRDLVRRRLLEISNIVPTGPWGRGDYIAAHIRMGGDFEQPVNVKQLSAGRKNNLKIPLSWYTKVLAKMRAVYPSLPIKIVSDGSEGELRNAAWPPGTTIERTGSDLGDLFMLASASFLVGSNSTYSRWAAFLGDMPSVWLRTDIEPEKPTGVSTPIHFVGIDDPGSEPR